MGFDQQDARRLEWAQRWRQFGLELESVDEIHRHLRILLKIDWGELDKLGDCAITVP